MAMVLMAIGTAAVMSMQKASVQGNLDARRTDLANSIARTWVDRLQRDAMMWTVAANATPSVGLTQSTIMLGTLYANGGKWDFPIAIPASVTDAKTSISPCYDALGRELDKGTIAQTPAQFCVHARAVALSPVQDLLRVDVRVIWLRGIAPPVGQAAPTLVSDATLATSDNPSPTIYHSVYATTSVMESPAQAVPGQGIPVIP